MRTFFLIMATAVLCGCANVSHSAGTAKLSRDLVEKSLLKGKTTKEQVRALLGEPQSTTSGSFVNIPGAPAETWTYTKTFYRDAMEKEGAAGSLARFAVTGSLYDRVETSVLIVMFDGRGHVTGHTFSTAHVGSNQE